MSALKLCTTGEWIFFAVLIKYIHRSVQKALQWQHCADLLQRSLFFLQPEILKVQRQASQEVTRFFFLDHQRPDPGWTNSVFFLQHVQSIFLCSMGTAMALTRAFLPFYKRNLVFTWRIHENMMPLPCRRNA